MKKNNNYPNPNITMQIERTKNDKWKNNNNYPYPNIALPPSIDANWKKRKTINEKKKWKSKIPTVTVSVAQQRKFFFAERGNGRKQKGVGVGQFCSRVFFSF